MSGPGGAPGPSPDAGAMAGWAQLLHDVLERGLRGAGGTDLVAPSWDRLFDDALATVLQAMVTERLERASAEDFLAAYRSVHGDAATLAELDALVATRERLARRERSVLRLAAEAQVAGRLPLALLGVGETVEIGLFDPTSPRLAAWRSRDDARTRPLHRVLRVRLRVPTTGEVHVVTDTWTGAVWADRWRTPPVAPMTVARIGTPVPGRDEVPAEVTLHAPLVLRCGDPASSSAATRVEPPQIVRYVRTPAGRLLLDDPGGS